ncbi:hypothetical protein [Planktotalea sp.]|uniref:hypothetical protein n=1 Tax=Planktotalea sp. TaxID=2029877 RepID=UPI003D6A2A4A
MITPTRFLVCAVLATAVALPVSAKSKKDRICEAFGAASHKIAQLRLSGKSESEAQLAYASENADSDMLKMQLVPAISSYVYGLTDEQLAGDVETPAVDQCKAYQG